MARDLPKEVLLIDVWANCATELSRVGACERAQVGCILTPPDLSLPIGAGYNGPASGLPNRCARPLEAGNCGCVHAESNACIKAPRGPKWAFITIPPCEGCAKMLVNAEVECVVYVKAVAHREGLTGGIDLLDSLGIPHGTPAQIVEQLLDMSVEEESTDSRVLGQEPWEPEDFAAAKAQTSRFADE